VSGSLAQSMGVTVLVSPLATQSSNSRTVCFDRTIRLSHQRPHAKPHDTLSSPMTRAQPERGFPDPDVNKRKSTTSSFPRRPDDGPPHMHACSMHMHLQLRTLAVANGKQAGPPPFYSPNADGFGLLHTGSASAFVPGAASDLTWTLHCLRLEKECGRARQAGILGKAGSGWAILAACPPSAEPRYLNLAAVTLTSMPRVTACLPFSAELGHPIRLADVPSGRSNTIEPPTLGAQYLVVRSGDPSPSTPCLLLPYDR